MDPTMDPTTDDTWDDTIDIRSSANRVVHVDLLESETALYDDATSKNTFPGVKRIYKLYVPSQGRWIISDIEQPELEPNPEEMGPLKYAKWKDHPFVIRRKIIQKPNSEFPTITTRILTHSAALIAALKVVMEAVKRKSWNVVPFKVDPQLLVYFFPRLKDHLDAVKQACPAGDETIEHLSSLIQYLETAYSDRLQKIENFIHHGEITFDLVPALFLPPMTVLSDCSITSQPRAYRLCDVPRLLPYASGWALDCEYVDSNGYSLGFAGTSLHIRQFDGVLKIPELSVYPIERHPDSTEVQEKLVERGKRWVERTGVCHMHYKGVAYKGGWNEKVAVDGRFMVDRGMFEKHKSDVWEPPLYANIDVFDDDHALLATPILYGFALADKLWLMFDIECVSEIEWNDTILPNLALDPERKILLQSLVESHSQQTEFDDFVQGKGRGLIFNLYGPPGVGKTLTAEAVCERAVLSTPSINLNLSVDLRRPFYVASAGELGTDPASLDKALNDIFDLAPSWNAIVLIDEADVFLAERGIGDVHRNAMVAVFLRQTEYFRGILFMTTNRVETFDQAFQSRIHLSLRYEALSQQAKKGLWQAFVRKTQDTTAQIDSLTEQELHQISKIDMNGRQIKNTVKLASALARHESQSVSFQHLIRAIGAQGYEIS